MQSIWGQLWFINCNEKHRGTVEARDLAARHIRFLMLDNIHMTEIDSSSKILTHFAYPTAELRNVEREVSFREMVLLGIYICLFVMVLGLGWVGESGCQQRELPTAGLSWGSHTVPRAMVGGTPGDGSMRGQ